MRQVQARRRFLAFQIGLVLALVSAGPAWGQNILAQYTFATGCPAGNGTSRTGPGYEAQTVDPKVTAADISISDAIPDTTESGWIEYTCPSYTDACGNQILVLRVPPGSGSSTPDLAVLADRYIQFSVTANCGAKLNLTSLDFDTARGGCAVPRGFVIMSDVQGFCDCPCNFIDTELVPTVRPNLTHFSVDMSGSKFQGLAEITVRIYLFVPGSGQSLEFLNITLNGTAQ